MSTRQYGGHELDVGLNLHRDAAARPIELNRRKDKGESRRLRASPLTALAGRNEIKP